VPVHVHRPETHCTLPPEPHWFRFVHTHTDPLHEKPLASPCALQLLPQPPQFPELLVMLSSQPLSEPVAGWLQFAHPATQLEVHRPPLHSADATFVTLHAWLQLPQ
jgi:hypothetical protein